jgi:hypothetical protein
MTPSDRRLLSLVLLSFAVVDHFGNLSSVALVCVFLSVVLGAWSFVPVTVGPPLPQVLGIGLVLALGAVSVLYNTTMPNLYTGNPGTPLFLGTFGLVAAAIILHSVVKATLARVVAFGMAAAALAIGIATNITWGSASIDVFQFQQTSSQALLHGRNPYSPIVPSPVFVQPGVPTWLHLHFPYGPIVPVLEAPFRLLGDVRMLHAVAAVTTAAAVLVLAHRAGTLDRSACVVMAFPLTVAMVLFSWVDIITMAGLAVWVVSFRTHPRIAMFALVLALAAKPTTLIALVPIFFWSIRARRQVVIAGLIAALFVLPFAAVTGFSQFYYNVVGVQLAMPPGLGSLTVNSYLNSYGLPILPFAVSALIVATATVLVLRHRPRTYGELLTGTAVIATVSFLVAKWAYFNYYYIPAVLLMLAIAGNDLAVDVPEMMQPPAILRSAADWWRANGARLWNGRRVPGAAASVRRETGRTA